MHKFPVIVGRFEYIDIIDVALKVPAKIDTGAYRSSIHTSSVAEKAIKGKKVLEFTLFGHPVHGEQITLHTTHYSKVEVRSSNGSISERYEVKLKVRLGYIVFRTSFTLSDRSSNVFPVLIGRKALRKRFIVDCDKTGLSRRTLVQAIKQISSETEDIEGINT